MSAAIDYRSLEPERHQVTPLELIQGGAIASAETAAPDLRGLGMSETFRHPTLSSRELDRLDAEERLIDYIKMMWHVLHPRKELKLGWALECLCEHLEAVHRGEIARLMINVPPGFMKSLASNVFFSTWEWGPRSRPDLSYLTFSHDLKLTIRDNRKARALIRSPIYQECWGDRFQISKEQDAKTRFDTMDMGYRIAASVGSATGTGERGDRIIIDDPHQVSKVDSEPIREKAIAWFSNEITTRINDESSVVVAIGQRTRSNDMFGVILKANLGFEWLCLPMEYERDYRCFTSVPRKGLEPERRALVQREEDPIPKWIPEDELGDLADVYTCQSVYPQDRRAEEGELLQPNRYSRGYIEGILKPSLRLVGGTYAEAGQLQQRPSPKSGGQFKREFFQMIHAHEVPEGLAWVRGYDLAGTKKKRSPYTAAVLMAFHEDGRVFIADVVRERHESHGVYSLMRKLAKQDGDEVIVDFPQDPGQAGLAQVRTIKGKLRDLVDKVKWSPESGSKEVRANGLAGDGAAGNLFLVRGIWNSVFIAEAILFPRGDFQDQIDAASRAYARLIKLPKGDDTPSGSETVEG